jgi:hypothetical protein
LTFIVPVALPPPVTHGFGPTVPEHAEINGIVFIVTPAFVTLTCVSELEAVIVNDTPSAVQFNVVGTG